MVWWGTRKLLFGEVWWACCEGDWEERDWVEDGEEREDDEYHNDCIPFPLPSLVHFAATETQDSGCIEIL